MTYTTLLVNLSLGQSNAHTLAVALQLAQGLGASVVGVAGGHAAEPVYDNGYAGDDPFALAQEGIEHLLQAAHAEFVRSFPLGDWRASGAFESLSGFAARNARSADLVLTGVPTSAPVHAAWSAQVADLIMDTGRPVLVVPSECTPSALGWVVVAWTDTREARRAVADAMPLLARAHHVQLVEIVQDGDQPQAQARLDDVAAWLARHAVVAHTSVALHDSDDADQLATIAQALGADLVVAGAYGHSRAREWVLGGMTRCLLHGTQRCSLLSH